MAEREPSAYSNTLTGSYRRPEPPAPQAKRLVDNLRGVPDSTPSLEDASALRKAGWRLVVAYCRISFDAHRRDGHGVEDQARHCARIAARHRMLVVHVYIDNGKSASKAGVVRPDFDAMIDALLNGTTTHGYPVDGVVCVADDRLYRDLHTYQHFVKAFTSHTARAYADQLGEYDLYCDEAAHRGLLGAAAARAESKKQQQRAQLNHRSRAERGEPVASRRPFGWNDDKLTLCTGESEVVRQGVQGLLGGKTLTAVTQDFNSSGYTTTLGNTWQCQTVKHLLRNPRICGYRKLHGELVTTSAGEPVVGQWEPIVSPGEWRAIAALLDQKRHAGGWSKTGDGRHSGGSYLLTGLVRCGRHLADGRPCNTQLYGSSTGDSHLYRCRTATDGGCGRISRQGPSVDQLVVEHVFDKLEQQGNLLVQPSKAAPNDHQLKIAHQRKASLQEQWYTEEVSDSQYFARLRSEEADIKRLVNERKAWAAEQQESTSRGTDLRTEWNVMTLSEKRGVLLDLLDAVIILPGTKGSHRFDPTTVIPVWREPDITATPEQ